MMSSSSSVLISVFNPKTHFDFNMNNINLLMILKKKKELK